MLCADARGLLDRGLAPGSGDALRTVLGFHLAACAACRTHRMRVEAQRLLGALLTEPMRPAPTPLPLYLPHHKQRRPNVRAGISATLLVAGALAIVPLGVAAQGSGAKEGRSERQYTVTRPIAARACCAQPEGEHQHIAANPLNANIHPEADNQRGADRAWLAARLAVPVKAAAPGEFASDFAQQLNDMRALKFARPAAPPARDVSAAWSKVAPTDAAEIARSQLFAFEQAGPQQQVPQVIVDGAPVEYAIDAALGELPLEMGRTLFIPDDPQPPPAPPLVVAVPGLPQPDLPPALPPTKPAPKPTKPAPKPTAPAPVQRYVVQSGDTLSAIALKLYGNASLWPQIYAANRGVIGGNPDLIFPQQRYTVPGRTVSGNVTAPRPYLPVKAVTPAPKGQPYTVKKGDSMRGIARGYYHDEMRWREIYKANAALIPDPDNLRIGISLRIP